MNSTNTLIFQTGPFTIALSVLSVIATLALAIGLSNVNTMA